MRQGVAAIMVAGALAWGALATAAENGVIIGQQPFGCRDKKQYLALLELGKQGERAAVEEGINAALITGACYKFGLNEAIEILERDGQANLAKVHPKKLPKLPGKNDFFTSASQLIVKK